MSASPAPGAPEPPRPERVDRWLLVVPVKALSDAKSRLSPVLDDADRRALVLEMLVDVLAACLGAARVAEVRVVTADPDVAAIAEAAGAVVVRDDVPRNHPDPLNAALRAALPPRPRWPFGVLTADLPELTAGLLDAVLVEARRHVHSVLPDHTGEGTTMAFWTPGADEVVPRFGPGSARAHVAAGDAVDLAGPLALSVGPALGAARRDVDTPDDVLRLRRLRGSGRSDGGAAVDGGQWRP